MDVRSTKEWILIANVFKLQWTEPVKKLILDNHRKMVPLPNLMSYFQPLYLTVNRCCKAFFSEAEHKIGSWSRCKNRLHTVTRPPRVFKPLTLLARHETLTCVNALFHVTLGFWVREFIVVPYFRLECVI